MAFMNRASLHLALYESAYATTPKVVETTVSEVPKVGFKIPVGHVKRVMKNPFTGDGTKSAREHMELIEDICGLFRLPGISEDQVKRKLLYLSLSGNARDWYMSLDEEVKTDWSILREVFLKYFTPKESTNILQEKEDEQLENDELDLPTSPSTNDSNTQTQKSFIIYENPCYDECETKNAP